jgi:hypothetical protein
LQNRPVPKAGEVWYVDFDPLGDSRGTRTPEAGEDIWFTARSSCRYVRLPYWYSWQVSNLQKAGFKPTASNRLRHTSMVPSTGFEPFEPVESHF